VDPASFRWAGERGYNLMMVPWVFPHEASAGGVRLYREARAAAGHAGPGKVLTMYPCHVAESAAAARAQAEPAWSRWRELTAHERPRDPSAPDFARRWDILSYDEAVAQHRAIFGGPEDCIAAVRWIAETYGATQVALVFHFAGIDHQAALRAIELWGREVAPALR
jgi:alkanesulfonate monooxygenase SsuD/methylene tetrahydromethanopterin reductase-like flavin-dependent oxidoreductase (luciferase family)